MRSVKYFLKEDKSETYPHLFLFYLVYCGFFSCKAPATSTQGPTNNETPQPPENPGSSTTIPSSSLPHPSELQFPYWWIEESYTQGGFDGKGRPGSPTAVVFQSGANSSTVMGRTSGGTRLDAIGTYEKTGDGGYED